VVREGREWQTDFCGGASKVSGQGTDRLGGRDHPDQDDRIEIVRYFVMHRRKSESVESSGQEKEREGQGEGHAATDRNKRLGVRHKLKSVAVDCVAPIATSVLVPSNDQVQTLSIHALSFCLSLSFCSCNLSNVSTYSDVRSFRVKVRTKRELLAVKSRALVDSIQVSNCDARFDQGQTKLYLFFDLFISLSLSLSFSLSLVQLKRGQRLPNR
jgi:hypothetical protein